MEKVERIQYQAAIAITDAWQGSSRSKIYGELGWETLSDLLKCSHSLQVHNIINNSTLSYLKGKLPLNCKVMLSANILTTFHEIICKSNRYMNSFFPDAIASWNIFMNIFQYKEVPSIGMLKKDIRPESKRFFKIHYTVGLRYPFQLRVGFKSFERVTNVVTTSLIPHLVSVILTKALKIQIISYSHAHFIPIKEQPL